MKRMNLNRAIVIAAEAHEGQKPRDENTPYIVHPLTLMTRMNTEDERIVATLHDVVEDSDKWTLERLEAEGLPLHLSEALSLITHGSTPRLEGESMEDYLDRRERTYLEYIRNMSGNSIARKVKMADLKDNIGDGREIEGNAWFNARLKKYLKALTILQEVDQNS